MVIATLLPIRGCHTTLYLVILHTRVRAALKALIAAQNPEARCPRCPRDQPPRAEPAPDRHPRNLSILPLRTRHFANIAYFWGVYGPSSLIILKNCVFGRKNKVF